jgi:hypothetical protein
MMQIPRPGAAFKSRTHATASDAHRTSPRSPDGIVREQT